MEHNDEHAGEYRRWAEQVTEASADLLAAIEAMERVNQTLAIALEKLDGAPPHLHSH
jgi:hypothetical protein